MHTYNYVPTIARETPPKEEGQAPKPAKWEGHVTLRVLSIDDSLAVKTRGGAISEAEKTDKLAYSRFIVDMAREWKDRFVEIDLKRLSDGREFKSWEDLQYGAAAHQVLVECVLGLINGFDEGNG